MPKFSANLGFLFGDVALPEAIHAAKRAGFDAVECHWPYQEDPKAVAKALRATGLAMLGLNTARGRVSAGENGLSALPGREVEARVAIEQAFDYAAKIDAKAVHVMAGKARGDAAREAFLSNLSFACDLARPEGRTVLIEPLNAVSAPEYFLENTFQAADIIQTLGRKELRLMFDCFHVQMTEGNLTHRLNDLFPLIGHIQFAAAPMRGTPDQGEVNFAHVFEHIDRLGWTQPLGAEYLPEGPTEDRLGWMRDLQR